MLNRVRAGVTAGLAAGLAVADIDGDNEFAIKASGIGGYKYFLDDVFSVVAEGELGFLIGDTNYTMLGVTFGVTMKF